jgi:hypothetical protein
MKQAHSSGVQRGAGGAKRACAQPDDVRDVCRMRRISSSFADGIGRAERAVGGSVLGLFISGIEKGD